MLRLCMRVRGQRWKSYGSKTSVHTVNGTPAEHASLPVWPHVHVRVHVYIYVSVCCGKFGGFLLVSCPSTRGQL